MRLSLIKEAEKPNLSRLITKDIKNLGDLFDRYDEEIRIVGGAVRDALLGKQPKDIDLATTATPDKMLKIAEDNDIKVIETGLQHGTVTFVINGEPYEITTLRVDTETDGRHASVDWTTSFKEDARRRDLTYNAMSVDMQGNLHDYFGGLEDLRKKTTQFVGNAGERIQEDFLRILRYFRFLSKHPGETPDEKLVQTISDNVSGLEKISGERIWMELSKMATYPNFPNALRAMCSVGIDNILSFDTCSNEIVNEVARVQNETNNPITILSLLFNSTGSFLKFASKLKIPNEYKNLGQFIVERKNDPKESYNEEIMTNKASPESVLELAKVVNSAELRNNTQKLTQAGSFPVTGNDLIEKGIKPGPELGKTLNALKSAWINSGFSLNKEQLLNKVGNK